MIAPEFYHDPNVPSQPDQYEGEFSALLRLYCQTRPKRVIEIGVRLGGTLYQWIKHAPPGAQVFAIDWPGKLWGYRDGPPPTWDWILFSNDFGVPLSIRLADSHEAETVEWARVRSPFDWLFIDADHSYSGVKADYENYRRMVSPGGYIILHDILPDPLDAGIQVWQLWQEISTERSNAGLAAQSLTSSPAQPGRGLGVLRV